MRCRHYHYIKDKCSSFILYGTPTHIDIRLDVSDEELKDRDEMPGGFIEPECNREFYKLHKTLRLQLLQFNCAVIHGVALNLGGQGIVFTASSGVGKSVQADLWKDTLFNGVDIINDDWPILRLVDNRVFVSSSPWCGHRNIYCKKEVPLSHILFVERAEKPFISEVGEAEIVTELIKRFSMLYSDLAKHSNLYAYIEAMVPFVHFRRAGVNLDSESVFSILSILQ